jgi:hypothetical protein
MNLENISTDQADRIVGAGIELMAAITAAFGSEDGIQVWNALSDTLGNDFKSAIFMAMLQGRTSGVVVVQPAPKLRAGTMFIDTIKVIRQYTGMGLKDAKDFADELNDGRTKTVEIKFDKRNEFIQGLRNCGVTAT